jgi:serine phosphatase RsbU (regulator of sigma subunit)
MSRVAQIGWCVASALAVFLAWIALGVSVQVGIGFLYAVPVALSSWWFGWRGGLAAVVASIALFLIGAAIHPVPHFGLSLALRGAIFIAVAAVFALLRERLFVLEHSAEELEAIRAALAPPTLPEIAGVDVAAAFVPSELGVSGDFYLLTNGPDGSTLAVVGDVVGHGPKAAQLATFVRARLAAFTANTSEPAEILALANRAIVERPGRRQELISAICLRFSAETSILAWAVAGHPQPLRLPGLQALDAKGETILLGVQPELALATSEVPLDEGDGVLVYTDGATDVRGREDAMLGLDGFRAFLKPLSEMPASALVAGAEQAILSWAEGPIKDDLCILALRPAPD